MKYYLLARIYWDYGVGYCEGFHEKNRIKTVQTFEEIQNFIDDCKKDSSNVKIEILEIK